MGRVVLLVLLAALAFGSPASAQQIMPVERLESLRSRLPTLADREWHAALHSPAVVFYTDAELPRAYQHQGTFHSPRYNISGDPTDAGLRHGEGGNANVQFPWLTAGGGDRAIGLSTFKGLLLPERPGGDRWPVVVANGRMEGMRGAGDEPGLRWIYPVGSIAWEVLETDLGGRPVVFEVRARLRESNRWDVEVFRPFPRCEDLAAELARRDRDRYAAQIERLLRPEPVQFVDVSDRANRTRPAFVGQTGVAWLPSLDQASVEQLLRVPFQTATGAHWKRGVNGVTCYAPTTDQRNQIVPTHYMGSLVGSDSDSCRRCHDGVARHSRSFDERRGWYGHVRGDDGIFSFHPIDPSSVSYNGGRLPVRLRQSFVAAGVVAWFSPADHPSAIYRRRNEE